MERLINDDTEIETEFSLVLGEIEERSMQKTIIIRNLPLVLINKDLKNIFQISDSTLNRLIKIGNFPACWYGIRGHYLRTDVLKWMESKGAEDFHEQLRLLRSL